MVDWWKKKEKVQLWDMEQKEIFFPLRQWALLDSGLRSIVMSTKSRRRTVYTAIMSIWDKCQQTLSPVNSPLLSFLYHPEFQEAILTFDGGSRQEWTE